MKQYKSFYTSGMKLNEWSYAPSISVDEADDDQQGMPPQQDPNAQGGMPPQGGDMGAPNGMPPQGGDMGADPSQQDPNAQGGMPPQDMGADPSQQDPNAQGGMPPQGGDMGADPSQMEGMGDMPTDGDEENTEELSVDDLTNAQEKLNDKMNSLGNDFVDTKGQMDKVVSAIEKLNDIISNNNSQIEDLKSEIERRNPTPTEKLELRSVNDSYPFNVSPKDYWKDKEQNSNYEAAPDAEKEYTITDDDLNDINDSEIAKTFDDDYEEGLDINRIFGK